MTLTKKEKIKILFKKCKDMFEKLTSEDRIMNGFSPASILNSTFPIVDNEYIVML